MKTSYKKERTHLFADQKASLEAMFCKNQFPSGDELAAKAAQLNIDLSRVQVGILVFFYVIIITYSETLFFNKQIYSVLILLTTTRLEQAVCGTM